MTAHLLLFEIIDVAGQPFHFGFDHDLGLLVSSVHLEFLFLGFDIERDPFFIGVELEFRFFDFEFPVLFVKVVQGFGGGACGGTPCLIAKIVKEFLDVFEAAVEVGFDRVDVHG